MIIVRRHIEGLTERSLERFATYARRAAGMRAQVNVVLTSDREIHGLNRCFRGIDEPTDVLSFPAITPGGFAGDIVISADIARRNARELGHEPSEEVKILVLHGILHLAGYDHETDNGRMARKEAQLRKELNLPLSLIERAHLRVLSVPHRRGKR